jgi:formylmethanofuran dehydrogenase subunit B
MQFACQIKKGMSTATHNNNNYYYLLFHSNNDYANITVHLIKHSYFIFGKFKVETSVQRLVIMNEVFCHIPLVLQANSKTVP